MFNSSIRGSIIQNHKDKLERDDVKRRDYNRQVLSGHGTWRLQYQDAPDDMARVWQKMRPEHIVDMLIAASSRPRYNPNGESTSYLAGRLLREMLHHPWVIEGAPHAGGENGSTSLDPNLHIRVRIIVRNGKDKLTSPLHLICKEEPRLHIIDITEGE
jgi:hypothetical protein